MAEILSSGSNVGYWSDDRESVTLCCYCQCSVKDPLMLSCLHNCCRSCIEISGSVTAELKSVRCPYCCEATDRQAMTPNGLLRNYRRQLALYGETVSCSTCGPLGTVAEFWCADCCAGLCDSCYSKHNRASCKHRSAELDVARTWSLSQLTPCGLCSKHERAVEIQCFTCRQPKCPLCYEACRARKHDMQSLSHAATRKHVAAIIKAISAQTARLGRLTSGLQEKCRSALLSAQLPTGRRGLAARKGLLGDACARVFNACIAEVCTNLQRIWVMCTGLKTRPSVLSEPTMKVAREMQLLLVWRVRTMQRLCESGLLKAALRRSVSLFVLSEQQCLKYWQENGSFSIEGSVPLSSDTTLSSCLGEAAPKRVGLHAPLHFGPVPVKFRTAVGCLDLAVTRDGHVLLAAREHGLLVYGSRGQRLNGWTPARRNNGGEDAVSCVAALSDGRAAVGVFWAQLVVLLRQSETIGTWMEDLRVAVLQTSPRCLAVCRDLLAVADYRRDEHRLHQPVWTWGRHVQLLRLNSGHLLYRQSRDYGIYRVAVTALCVVTTSRHQVKRNSGARPCVVDAFSHSGEFLWRYETNDDECVTGICASETWSRVYMVVAARSDWRNSRVVALSGADGTDRRDVMTKGTHDLQLPEFLSLARGQWQTVLAVLGFDKAAKKFMCVTLFEAWIE